MGVLSRRHAKNRGPRHARRLAARQTRHAVNQGRAWRWVPYLSFDAARSIVAEYLARRES